MSDFGLAATWSLISVVVALVLAFTTRLTGDASDYYWSQVPRRKQVAVVLLALFLLVAIAVANVHYYQWLRA